MATIKWICNGVEFPLGACHPFYLSSIVGLEPPEADITLEKAGYSDGGIITGTRLEPREVSIVIACLGDFRVARQTIYRAFPCGKSGELYYDDVKISGVVESVIPVRGNGIRSVTVGIQCADAYWHSAETQITQASGWVTDFKFALAIPSAGVEFDYRVATPLFAIENLGDSDIGLVASVIASTGTVENPKLLNVVTGEYIRAVKTMSIGDRIEFSTGRGAKKLTYFPVNGAAQNITNLLDGGSTFLQLAQGETNLRYSADSGESNMDVSVYYSPTRLGV